MKEKLNKIPWLVVGLFAVIAIFITSFWVMVSSNGQTKKLKKQNDKNIVMIDNYKFKIKNLSADKIIVTLKKDNIDVESSLEKVTSNIKKAVDLTYNQTKTEKDYKALSNKLPKLVGKDFSSKLIELDTPTLNQSGKKAFPFGQTTDVLVTFGKYSYKSIEVPVYVMVDYVSPPAVGSGKKIPGQDLFVMTYNLKTKKLQLNQYEKGAITNG